MPQRYTVLVAEDDEMEAFFLRRAFFLAELSHVIRFVPDGQQTIDYLQGNAPYADRRQFPAPDLLLLDLKMPGLDGFDVLRWMQRSGLDHPPVIVLTGFDLERERALALELGAREYHVKRAELGETLNFVKGISERWLEPVARSSRRASQPGPGYTVEPTPPSLSPRRE